MSRSFRKTPIIGIAGGKNASEALDKRKNNRILRRKVKVAVRTEADLLPEMREVSDPWTMSKDGKMWISFSKHPEYKRK